MSMFKYNGHIVINNYISCREGFIKLDIFTVPCLYMFALMLFAVKNVNIYHTNSSVHG